MTDDPEKQLKLELLAIELRLKRKQEFWETPRNVAILVGVTAAIAAAIGYWLRGSAPPPATTSPIFLEIIGDMNGSPFLDAIEAAGIVVIAAMLIYVVIRLDRTLTGAAEKIKEALAVQQSLHERINRVWTRVELIEQRVEERNAILPTAKLGLTLEEIGRRLDRLEGPHESPPINHD